MTDTAQGNTSQEETLQGAVSTGVGDGAYYMEMDAYQERFKEALGFYPFPGTLNLAVDATERERFTDRANAVEIDAPVRNGERLSAVTAYPVVIAPDSDAPVDGAVLDLEKTDHPDSVAEIIAPINLRDRFSLMDGDTLTVTAQPVKDVEEEQ